MNTETMAMVAVAVGRDPHHTWAADLNLIGGRITISSSST
jgi:hypothetical protein